MIERATEELLALAVKTRGWEWADGLERALAAAFNAGWAWDRAGLFASRLIFTADAWPRDLTEATGQAQWPAAQQIASTETREAAMARMRADLAARGAA